MSLEQTRSNKIMLLGRGVDEVADTNGHTPEYTMSRATRARADAVGSYWFFNKSAFLARDSKIVVSGGYARLARGQTPPPEDQREASKVADYLMEGGIPSRLLYLEIESGSTTDNYTEVLREGYFAGEVFNAENPLLLVASKEHGEHRGVPLARAAYGIDHKKGVQLLVGEKEGRKNKMQEFIGGIITEQVIAEVNPRPFSVEDMEKVGSQFEAILDSKAKVLGSVASDLRFSGFQYAPQPVDLIAV